MSGTIEIDKDEKIGKLILAKPLSTAQYLKLIDKVNHNYSYAKTYYTSDFAGESTIITAKDSYTHREVFRDSNNTGIYADIVFTKNSNEITFTMTDPFAGTFKCPNNTFLKNIKIVITEKTKTDTTADDSSKPADSQADGTKTDVPGTVSRDEN